MNRIKLYYNRGFFTNWTSELAILYSDISRRVKIDDRRFDGLINERFEFVDKVGDCDFIVLPYKWDGFNKRTQEIVDESKQYEKKLLIFYNDDDSSPIRVENSFIFRTSLFSNSRANNEFGLTPFFDDDFRNVFISKDEISLKVGFCGFDHFERKHCLSKLKSNKEIEGDFIIRNSFWAKEVEKSRAIFEFNQNIENNLFGFCSRGAGNFSYRFFQILSMGRIPLLLNTDCVLPFEEFIDYNKYCLIVDKEDIDEIDNILIQYYNGKSKEELFYQQEQNRKLYEDCLSPNGFLKMMYKFLKSKIDEQ